MCGIYGQIGFDPSQTDAAEAAVDTLRHRGPDSRGTWQGDGAFLGMRRLSIIDLAGGSQPIWNEDSTCCVVCNGEIYNFLDLRPLLEEKGHVFRTGSDSEVILHAYEEWGVECLKRFNGMFALAIWDRREKRLFLARDRIGEKPLYYFNEGGRLVFASEIKAILATPGVTGRLRLRGLANFLGFGHSIAPETIYEGISKLLPGHYLVASEGALKIGEYWDVGSEPRLEPLREDEYAARILELLDDSVRRRMIADVPLGAFLSGGVDSTAIVALMKRHATGPVKTFSLGFTIGGAYNELSDARRVALHLGTEHHELRVEHADLVATLRKLVYHYDEPFGDAASFPVYLLSRFAGEHVRVALSGEGGDELFGGYRRYAADRAAALFQRLPGARLLPALESRLGRFRRLRRTLRTLPIRDPARRYASWLEVFTPELRAELIRPGYRDEAQDPAAGYPYYYHRLNGSTANDHLNRLLYVDVKTWLADAYMEKADKAMMACGLEGRLPLLDHRLVELAFQIPGRYKMRGRSLKHVFKQALRGLVPEEVLRRPKHGFAVPLDPWFRGGLKNFAFELLLDARTRRRGYFNANVVERLWREHAEGRQAWDDQLWLLLNFELWHRIYLDGEAV